MYITLNNMTSAVQSVTVSSEGPAAQIYPDSMGQYNILRDVYRYDRPVYKHVDRKDRFIIYAGKIKMYTEGIPKKNRSVFANDKFIKLMQDVTRQRKIFEKSDYSQYIP